MTLSAITQLEIDDFLKNNNITCPFFGLNCNEETCLGCEEWKEQLSEEHKQAIKIKKAINLLENNGYEIIKRD